LVIIIYIGLSRFGSIRLGGNEAKPEFSTFAWTSMLFSAGMGIGLVYFEFAEPMFHYINQISTILTEPDKIRKAIALILGGGISALQSASIITGFPFAI
jgi:choline/glycine/proline betaine transport protein